MKLRRSLKLGALVVGALGIVGTFVPPASALGTKTIVFQGDAALNAGTGGLGAPCTDTTPPTVMTPDITPTKGTKSCPPEVAPCSPLPTCVSKNNKIVQVNGNTRGGRFISSPCVEVVGVSVLKTTKPDGPEAGTCTITASFLVTGYCGLSQGQGTGTATVLRLTDGTTQTITFNFTWIDPGGGNLIVYGNWGPVNERPPLPPDPNNQGDLVAYLQAVPLPEQVTPGAGSCLNKTETLFHITGVAELYNPKVLP